MLKIYIPHKQKSHKKSFNYFICLYFYKTNLSDS